MMVHKITLLILLITTFSSWTLSQQSDSVSYSLTFKDCCTEKIKTYGTNYLDWYVTDYSETKYTPQNNIVRLAKGKQYFLQNKGYGALNLPISTDDTFTIDTVITSCLKVKDPSVFFTWNSIYLECEDTLNGFYTEYYHNDSIRLKGNFSNGNIKDSLLYFYSNGQLKSLKTFYHSDTIYKTYHPNGQLSYIYHSGKRNTISYFKDGSVKSKRANSKMKSFNRYTKDQLWYKIKKRKQVAYYRNGHIKYKLKRKPLYFIDRLKPDNKKRSFFYEWVSYDTTGTKAKEITFYSSKPIRLYSIELNHSLENFFSLTYYENGKRSVSFFTEIYRNENYSYPIKYSLTYYENGQFSYFKDLLPHEFKSFVSIYESKYRQLTSPKKTRDSQ